jgi:hypothetical protein
VKPFDDLRDYVAMPRLTGLTGLRLSPDGSWLAATVQALSLDGKKFCPSIWRIATGQAAAGTAGSAGRAEAEDLLAGFDRWPVGATWAADSRSVYFAADDGGRGPVFRVDTGTGAITRLTTDGAAYSCLSPSPDGRFLYALRAAVDSPPPRSASIQRPPARRRSGLRARPRHRNCLAG